MLTRLSVRIRTLTPVHIGTGRVLEKDFDFVVRGGRTWVIRLERIWEEKFTDDPQTLKILERTPPDQLLRAEDLREGSPYVRYGLPGQPAGRELREAIKDPADRPYLPGTSLKGALRTVLAWHAWEEQKLTLGSVRLKETPKFAARPLEAKIFAGDAELKEFPHHDLLRALRVSDSQPQSPRCLEVIQVRVWSRKDPQAPLSVEAIRPGTEFTTTITIDETLFSSWAGREKLLHREWFDQIPKAAWKRANRLLQSQKVFWSDAGQLTATLGPLVMALNRHKESSSGFPLCLGFGVGWEGMTLGPLLKEDPQWSQVFAAYKLGRRGTKPQEFPGSRRAVVVQDRPANLLGWIWVEWGEEK